MFWQQDGLLNLSKSHGFHYSTQTYDNNYYSLLSGGSTEKPGY
ncbi:MAG TPA: hypothetical protein VIF86_06305 [Methylobacter sp.]